MKKGAALLLYLPIILLFINMISAASMPIYVKPLSGDGSLNPNTAYNYTFNWSTDSSCNNVIFSNSSLTVTTGSDGIGFINLTIPDNLASMPNYLCEYRNSALRKVHTLSTQFFNRVYITNLNVSQEIYTSGNITANTGFFDWLGSLANRVTKLFVIDVNVSNNLGLGGNLTVNTDNLFVDSNAGKVGIGTTTPSQKLEVAGAIQLSDNSGSNEAGTIRWTGAEFQAYNGTDWNTFGTTGGGASLWSQTGSDIYYNNGNVGIGTANPQNPLNVIGTINATGTIYSNNAAVLTSYSESDPYWTGNKSSYSTTAEILAFGYYNSSDFDINNYYLKSNPFGYYNSTTLVETDPKWTGNYSNVAFLNKNNVFGAYNQTFDTNTLFIDSNLDRIGIGTTSPDQPLEVENTGEFLIGWTRTGISNNWAFGADATGTYIKDITNGTIIMNWEEGGNVGIGTTSPSSNLHIISTASNIIKWQRGTNTWGFEIGTTDGIGLYNYQNTTFGWWVSNNGNVGIGTTSPTSKFQVKQSGTTYADGIGWVNSADTNKWEASHVGGVLYWGYNNADKLAFVGSSGRVGIGTTSPGALLDVNGLMSLSAATTETRAIEIGAGRTGDGYSLIDFVGDATYTDYGLRLIRANTGANTSSQLVHRGTGALQIWATDAGKVVIGTNNLERVRIDESGNVGIGTTSPLGKLNVEERTNTVGYHGLVASAYYGAGDTYIAKFDYRKTGDAGYDTKMVVRTDGKVGIGTTSPSSKLDVAGQVSITGASRIRITRGDAQNVNSQTVTIVQYNNIVFDNLGEYDNSINYRFTATEAGYYLVIASLLFDDASWTDGQYATLFIYKNGVNYNTLHRYEVEAAETEYINLHGSDMIYLGANEFIDIRVIHNRATATPIYGGAGNNYFAVHRLS